MQMGQGWGLGLVGIYHGVSPFGILLLLGSLALTSADAGIVELYPWESVGEIIDVSKNTLTIRRTLRISEASWVLEPGAVSEPSELDSGDQVLAKGKTRPDGTFETRRIYIVAPAVSRKGESGKTVTQSADHGAPATRVPTAITDPSGTRPESRGRGGYSGPADRIPVPTGPGGSPTPAPELRSARAPTESRIIQ